MKNLNQWPFVEAANYTKTDGRTIRLIVIHTMEIDEVDHAAEAVANYFASGQVQASAHLNIDNNSIVRGVAPKHVAWAAPGANSDGLQLELAGRAGQSVSNWDDRYSRDLLKLAADAVAQYSIRYKIPIRKLSNHELAHGYKGLIGHVQASEVYKQSTHTDPGSNFPWEKFIRMARYRKAVRTLTSLPTLKFGDSGYFVKYLQRRLNVWRNKVGYGLVTVDGTWNSKVMTGKVKKFQRHHHLEDDGIVGPATWKKLRQTP